MSIKDRRRVARTGYSPYRSADPWPYTIMPAKPWPCYQYKNRQGWLSAFLWFCFVVVCGAGNWTLCLAYAKQALYHRVAPQALEKWLSEGLKQLFCFILQWKYLLIQFSLYKSLKYSHSNIRLVWAVNSYLLSVRCRRGNHKESYTSTALKIVPNAEETSQPSSGGGPVCDSQHLCPGLNFL